MEKYREPREAGKRPSRRVFLQRVAGTGLATVAGVTLLPGLSEAGKGSTTPPAPVGGTSGKGTQTGGATGQTGGQTGKGTQTGGATGQTGGTTGTSTPTTNQPVAGAFGSDLEILNFALLLERLEAGFYNQNANKPYLTAVPGTATPTTPTTTTPTTPGTTTPTTPVAVPTTSSSLKSIVDEIRAHENAHVQLLEQRLGTNAQAAPTFRNIDAPTLQQFINMAQTFEDIGVSAYLGALPQIQDKGTQSLAGQIAAVEARHAGSLRTYQKDASTAAGGNPNLTLTEDGGPLNPIRTRDQVLAAIQNFLPVSATTPTPTTPTTTGGTSGTTPTTTTPTPTTTTPTPATGANPATPAGTY